MGLLRRHRRMGRRGIPADSQRMLPYLPAGRHLVVAAGRAMGRPRGLWIDNNDWSTKEHTLSLVNTPLWGIQAGTPAPGIPNLDFIASSSQYMYTADHADFDILGTEAYIASVWRGLMMWAWIWMDTTQTNANPVIMGKHNYTGDDRSYLLRMTTTGYLEGVVSSDGTAANSNTVTHSNLLPRAQWTFVALTFDPSTSLNVFAVDTAGALVKEALTTSIVASINNSATDFVVAAHNRTSGIANHADMMWSAGGIYPHRVEDASLTWLFNSTKAIFGL